MKHNIMHEYEHGLTFLYRVHSVLLIIHYLPFSFMQTLTGCILCRQISPPISWLVACVAGASSLARDNALAFISLCIMVSGTWNVYLIVRSLLSGPEGKQNSAQHKQEKVE